MLTVCLALVAANVLVVSLAAKAIGRLQRQHARREDLLLNQLLHATGKPWNEAPAATAARDRDDAEERAHVRFIASPEQLPVD